MYRSLFCYTRRWLTKNNCAAVAGKVCSIGLSENLFSGFVCCFFPSKNHPHHRHKFASQTGEMNANLRCRQEEGGSNKALLAGRMSAGSRMLDLRTFVVLL